MLLRPFMKFPEEGALVGRILAGYSEIEYELCLCLASVLQDLETAIRTLYRLRGEDGRLQVADALMRPHFYKIGLADSYNEMLGSVRWCKNVRNQYAHCQWWAEPEYGLFFHDLDELAKTAIGGQLIRFSHVDVPLLTQQEKYLEYAAAWVLHLRSEIDRRGDTPPTRRWPAPTIIPQPPRAYPPEKDPSRWDWLKAYGPPAPDDAPKSDG